MPTKVSVKVDKKAEDTSVPEQTASMQDDKTRENDTPVAAVIDLRSEGSQGGGRDSQDRVYANSQDERGYGDLEHNNHGGRDVPTQEVRGILDITGDGHGFLRPKFRPSDEDVYISASQIRKFSLRPGDDVVGLGRPPKENERYYGLLKVVKVNDVSAEKQGTRAKFEQLTPI